MAISRISIKSTYHHLSSYSSSLDSWCCTGAACMSAQKKARGLPGMKEGPLVQMLDRQRVLLPDLVILIEIEGVQWFETASCERGFSFRPQILTAQRHSMRDSLLACQMMICSNGHIWVCLIIPDRIERSYLICFTCSTLFLRLYWNRIWQRGRGPLSSD